MKLRLIRLFIVIFFLICLEGCDLTNSDKIDLCLSEMKIKLNDPYKLDSVGTNMIGDEDLYAYLTVTNKDKKNIIKTLRQQTTFIVLDSLVKASDANVYGSRFKNSYFFRLRKPENKFHGNKYTIFVDSVTNKVRVNYLPY